MSHYQPIDKRVAQTRKNRAYILQRKKVTLEQIHEHISTYVCEGKGRCAISTKKLKYEDIRTLLSEGYKVDSNPVAKGETIIQWE